MLKRRTKIKKDLGGLDFDTIATKDNTEQWPKFWPANKKIKNNVNYIKRLVPKIGEDISHTLRCSHDQWHTKFFDPKTKNDARHSRRDLKHLLRSLCLGVAELKKGSYCVIDPVTFTYKWINLTNEQKKKDYVNQFSPSQFRIKAERVIAKEAIDEFAEKVYDWHGGDSENWDDTDEIKGMLRKHVVEYYHYKKENCNQALPLKLEDYVTWGQDPDHREAFREEVTCPDFWNQLTDEQRKGYKFVEKTDPVNDWKQAEKFISLLLQFVQSKIPTN